MALWYLHIAEPLILVLLWHPTGKGHTQDSAFLRAQMVESETTRWSRPEVADTTAKGLKDHSYGVMDVGPGG